MYSKYIQHNAPEEGDTAAVTGEPVQAKTAADCNHTVGKAGCQSINRQILASSYLANFITTL